MPLDPQKIKDVFLKAVEQCEPGKWDAFLDAACEGDAQLRRRVEVLLQAHLGEDSLLDGQAGATPPTLEQSITERPGTIIGRYKLLEQIGEGGFGVVFMAEQEEPVRRKVALKIIKPGMDTRQVIARFEAERQVLAMMDHPHIARVFDAGTTDNGRPYFVMELVKGVPITDYCDEHHLTPRQRLELFVPVCQAVQHAHQKGIIHRDIKPSNILVAEYDDRPVPKVIDFGVAKAIEQRLTEKTMFTHLGQVVGTIDYMSPEQAKLNQLDIDTRSDVYSLGVVLYELLSGQTPFDRQRLRSAAFDEMLRIIREEEPPRPSLRLSSSHTLPSIAANRQSEPKKLSAAVHGELDWIVMKALEKDRTRRYETANGFAADIQRYLGDEPVEACPPSAAYRFKKFARRNKAVLSTIAVVAFALLLGIVGTSWQAIRATRAAVAERQAHEEADEERNRAVKAEAASKAEAARATREAKRAETEAAVAKAVNEFINNDLLAQASPNQEPDRDMKLRTALDRAAEKIEGRFEGQPLVEAAIRSTIGRTYFALGEYQEAERQFDRAHKLRKTALGSDHAGTLGAANDLAWVYSRLSRFEQARALAEETLERCRRVLGPEHPVTRGSMESLAEALSHLNRFAESERFYRDSLEIWRRVSGADPENIHRLGHNLANVLVWQGRSAEAEELLRPALEYRLRELGPEHPATLRCKGNLGRALMQQRCYAEAEELLREVVEIGSRVWGSEQNDTLFWRAQLASAKLRQGGAAEAGNLLQQVLESQRRVSGPEHFYTLITMRLLAMAMKEQGRRAEAEKLLQETLQLCRRALVPEHTLTTRVVRDLRNLWNARSDELRRAGDWPAAVALAREALELDPKFAPAHAELGAALRDWGKLDEAISCYRQALELDPNNAPMHTELGNALKALGKLDEAGACYRQAIELARNAVQLDPQRWELWNALSVAAYRTGDWKTALEARETSRQRRAGPYDWLWLSMIHCRLGDPKEARQWYEKAIQRIENGPPSKQPQGTIEALRREAEQLLGATISPTPPEGKSGHQIPEEIQAQDSPQKSEAAAGQQPES